MTATGDKKDMSFSAIIRNIKWKTAAYMFKKHHLWLLIQTTDRLGDFVSPVDCLVLALVPLIVLGFSISIDLVKMPETWPRCKLLSYAV